MGPASHRGLLLVETMMALLLFSIGILGTVALQAQAIRHISGAQYRGEAAHLAQSVIARMWAEDPLTLAQTYDSRQGGRGYRDFVALARALPGGERPGNAPDIDVAAGPSSASRAVSVTVRWQIPGEIEPHRHTSSAVIGRN